MTRHSLLACVAFMVSFLVLGQSFGQTRPAAKTPKGKQAKIQNAMTAAPRGISKNATILDWPETEGGEMAELRKGTNGWTCLPDMPATPANDPMCMDNVAMDWAEAWMSKKDPKLSGVALATCFRAELPPITTIPLPRNLQRVRIGCVSHPTSWCLE